MEEKKYKYIYNIDQANYLIKQGCSPIGLNRHDNKNVFAVFVNNTKFQNAMQKWNEKQDHKN